MLSSLFLIFFVAVDLTSCAIVETRQTSSDSYVQRNLNTIKSIYDLTVYPRNVPIIQQGASAVPPGLFDPSATGRITPLGNFTGFEDSIEYFFGLAPLPQSNPAGVAIFKSEVVEFTSGCPEVASSVVYLHVGQVNQTTGELIEGAKIAFWRFDDQGLVNKYDAWIPTLQLWTTTSSGIDYSNPLVQANVPAMALCPTIQNNCKGTNQQFTDQADCVAQLTQKPFGTFDEVWGDNLVCRIIHLLLTTIRPEAHCPHVGPVGGNGPDNFKCVNIDYTQGYFGDDSKLWGSTVDTFSCPSA